MLRSAAARVNFTHLRSRQTIELAIVAFRSLPMDAKTLQSVAPHRHTEGVQPILDRALQMPNDELRALERLVG
jgi:hypothetical protein